MNNKETMQFHYEKARLKSFYQKNLGFFVMELQGLFVFSLAKNKCLNAPLCTFASLRLIF
jgi:hypothetical protein